MSSILDNLQAVHAQIRSAAQSATRDPARITLLAVSKTFGAEAVLEAAQAGQRAFGENYLQEAVDKITALRASHPQYLLEWHFIGPIQSNKTRPIAEHFDWVHSVEREKIAQRLSDQRPEHLPPLNVCRNAAFEIARLDGDPGTRCRLRTTARAVSANARII